MVLHNNRASARILVEDTSEVDRGWRKGNRIQTEHTLQVELNREDLVCPLHHHGDLHSRLLVLVFDGDFLVLADQVLGTVLEDGAVWA